MGKALRKMLGVLLALAFALWLPAGAARAANAAPEPRMTATVVEFQVRGGLDEQSGAIIADLMMSAIANTGRFVLRDRLPLSAAAKIAKASELGETGLLDPKTAAELGRRYEVDAVVTGGVYKLGDLITVTARLIDTRNASLLRSGQIQGKDIDTIQIKINDLAAMITAPPDTVKTYGLTIKADPADASVRLVNSPKPYQPGIQLPPGEHDIEVMRPGYVARKGKVRITDRDVTVNIALEKAKYGLTVRSDPADAQIRLLNSPTGYQPGVALPPGDYEIEATREGYVSRKLPVQITDREVTVNIALEKARYGLTVRPEPPDAQVRLLNSPTVYQPGVALAPGDYEVEVTREGYAARKLPVKIVGGDVVVQVALEKAPPPPPAQYRLTVLADPPQATVRLLNSPIAYQPGVQLPPGDYQIEAALAGYETTRAPVRLVNSDIMLPIRLKKIELPATYRLTVQPDPATAQVRLVDSNVAYQPGVALAPGRYTIEATQSGYEPAWATVQITNSDLTVPVKLIRKAEEPAKPPSYRLTVRTDPDNAQVKLLGTKTAYKSGVSLPPGSYTVEVSQRGYESQRTTVRIVDSDVTIPITLVKVAEPTRYRLTVRTDPANAQVKLLGTKVTYKPGVSLPPGTYTVEVSQTGYESQRTTARIVDSDVMIPVTLGKLPEPTQYRLTVQTDPPGAQVRLRGARTSYRPGVSLAPGSYTVEVSQAGYETKQVPVRIVDSDATIAVALFKKPEPTQYRLTVQTDPPGAQVRLRGTRTGYRPGVALAPGSYTVEVSQPGYETKQVPVRIVDSDAAIAVTLVREAPPEQYRLTVRADPADARVRLVNSSYTYRPGVLLPPGSYVVEVTGRGYETKRETVRISDGDVTLPVELEKIAVATPPPASTSTSTVTTRPGEWRISAVSADSSLGGPDRSEFMRIFGGYVGQTVTRGTLLNGAMRFYQSTGITLSFAVRTSGSGAELSGRAAKRVRRTYESNIPIMTPSQLENSGFGVSVQ